MKQTAVATTKKANLAAKFAEKFSVDESEVMDIIKSTAFKQRDGNAPSDNQMAALMIVADQYGLNPFVREIYAYPDQGGIVPVVGVDGWNRIMNDHPQMDGIEFNYSEETTKHKGKTCHVWIEAVITRKDRSKPIVAREYFDEVVREVSFKTPWDSHPKRMHRHKAAIQAARIAFGFSGIYDEDEAERIIEKDITPTPAQAEQQTEPTAPIELTDDEFHANEKSWQATFMKGYKKGSTVNDFIGWVEAKGKLLTVEQKEVIAGWVPIEGEATPVDDEFVNEMNKTEGGE